MPYKEYVVPVYDEVLYVSFEEKEEGDDPRTIYFSEDMIPQLVNYGRNILGIESEEEMVYFVEYMMALIHSDL